MYKTLNKTKAMWSYTEALAIHNGAPIVHWEDNTYCTYAVESKRVTPRVKQIDITVCFLQKKPDNGIFVTKYEKSSAITEDI